MCGIVGFVGDKDSLEKVLVGLKSLEYRGYDSAGVAVIEESGGAKVFKQLGEVNNIRRTDRFDPAIKTKNVIGHTRWATHGKPSADNAHPHCNTSKTIHVVHNGIIENFQQLKEMLASKGYKFISETDTEVIPHLIDYNLKSSNSFLEAFEKTLHQLQGAYAIACSYNNEPDKIFVARLSSPLVVGAGDKSHAVASDKSAIVNHVQELAYLEDYDFGYVSSGEIKLKNLAGRDHDINKQAVDEKFIDTDLGEFKHFLEKEIFETPETVRLASTGRVSRTGEIRLGGLTDVAQQLQFIDRIIIAACGTSYYAGLIGEYLIEEVAGIPVEVQLSSEFKYRQEPYSRSTAVIAISQSGETADTIAALKKFDNLGILKLGIVNAPGSTISRITDAGVYCHAGPELSVASTKAFIAQVTVLSEIALFLSKNSSSLNKKLAEEILDLPNKISEVLEQSEKIEKIAKKYAKHRDFLYIGRGYCYPAALEGALKLKELSYIHAEGYASGEMKHGPLAMIDNNFPTVAIATKSDLLEKTASNIQEIKARSGPVIGIITKGDKDTAKHCDDFIEIPDTLEQTTPILVAIAEYLFAYYVACENGKNVDRPRNLAKSVTVE